MNSPLLKFYGLYSEKENQETPRRWPAGRICRLIEMCACPPQLHLCVRVRAPNVQLCANEHKPSVLLPCPTGISIQPRPRQTIRGGKTWINLPLLVFIQRWVRLTSNRSLSVGRKYFWGQLIMLLEKKKPRKNKGRDSFTLWTLKIKPSLSRLGGTTIISCSLFLVMTNLSLFLVSFLCSLPSNIFNNTTKFFFTVFPYIDYCWYT